MNIRLIRNQLPGGRAAIILTVLAISALPGTPVSAAVNPARTTSSFPIGSTASPTHATRIHLHLPFGVAYDARGQALYVVDTLGGRLLKLSPNGRLLWVRRNVGYDRTYAHDNQDAMGVGVDGAGNVYVAEEELGQVQKFSSSGKALATWRDFFPMGQGRGPTDIAVDAQGDAYVTGNTNGDDPIVQKLSPSGTQLWQTSLGHRVTAIAVDATGNLFAAYQTSSGGHTTIAELSPGGQRLATLKPKGITALALAVDSQGNLFAAHYYQDVYSSLVKISPTGAVLWKRDACICQLWALAIDPRGFIYADYPALSGGHVKKISPLGTVVASWKTVTSGAVNARTFLDIRTAELEAKDLPAPLHSIQQKVFYQSYSLGTHDFCWDDVTDTMKQGLSEVAGPSRGNFTGLHECAFLYGSNSAAHGGYKYLLLMNFLGNAKKYLSPIRIGDEARISKPPTGNTNGSRWIFFRSKNVAVLLQYGWFKNPVLSVSQFTQLARTIASRLQ